jgi:hypothetical protein
MLVPPQACADACTQQHPAEHATQLPDLCLKWTSPTSQQQCAFVMRALCQTPQKDLLGAYLGPYSVLIPAPLVLLPACGGIPAAVPSLNQLGGAPLPQSPGPPVGGGDGDAHSEMTTAGGGGSGGGPHK